jgi:hypothetical protein
MWDSTHPRILDKSGQPVAGGTIVPHGEWRLFRAKLEPSIVVIHLQNCCAMLAKETMQRSQMQAALLATVTFALFSNSLNAQQIDLKAIVAALGRSAHSVLRRRHAPHSARGS